MVISEMGSCCVGFPDRQNAASNSLGMFWPGVAYRSRAKPGFKLNRESRNTHAPRRVLVTNKRNVYKGLLSSGHFTGPCVRDDSEVTH